LADRTLGLGLTGPRPTEFDSSSILAARALGALDLGVGLEGPNMARGGE
jgi:hypothetical protein